MSAVLAIIADDGRAIVVIDREAVVINYVLLHFSYSSKNFDGRLGKPLPQRIPEAGYNLPTKPCCWRGKQIYHGGDVCVLVSLPI